MAQWGFFIWICEPGIQSWSLPSGFFHFYNFPLDAHLQSGIYYWVLPYHPASCYTLTHRGTTVSTTAKWENTGRGQGSLQIPPHTLAVSQRRGSCVRLHLRPWSQVNQLTVRAKSNSGADKITKEPLRGRQFIRQLRCTLLFSPPPALRLLTSHSNADLWLGLASRLAPSSLSPPEQTCSLSSSLDRKQ